MAAHQAPPSLGSPGKNTGVGCHFLLQCMKVKSQSEVAQSCLTLSDLMDCSPPGSSVHGIFQARVLEWVAIAFSNILLRRCVFCCFQTEFYRTLTTCCSDTKSASTYCLKLFLLNVNFGTTAKAPDWSLLAIHSKVINGRRQWQPTPVLLPRESHGWRSLVGFSPWGREESDTTK